MGERGPGEGSVLPSNSCIQVSLSNWVTLDVCPQNVQLGQTDLMGLPQGLLTLPCRLLGNPACLLLCGKAFRLLLVLLLLVLAEVLEAAVLEATVLEALLLLLEIRKPDLHQPVIIQRPLQALHKRIRHARMMKGKHTQRARRVKR